MKIHDHNAATSTPASQRTGEVSPGHTRGNIQGPGGPRSDTVELSDAAAYLSRVEQINREDRAEHLARIAKALETGRYSIPASQIAGRLIAAAGTAPEEQS